MDEQFSGSTEAPVDSGFNNSEENINSESTDSSVSQETAQPAGNPAWGEALSAIPQEFHPHLTKHLSEWDKGVQQRFQKVQQQYAPYKEFADLNVAPEDINEAMQLRHALENNPQELYSWMQDQYQFGQKSQGQQEASEEEEYELSETDAFFTDPRYLELQNKANFAEQAIRQFNETAVNNRVSEQVRTETTQVQEQFPGLNIVDVATYALGMSNQSGGMPDLVAAATKMQAMLPVPRVSDSAPPVVSGNRGLPSNTQSYGSMSSDERSKFVADYMKATQQE